MNHPLFIVTLWLIFGLILGKFIVPPAYLTPLPYIAITVISIISSFQLSRFIYRKGKKPNGYLLFVAVVLLGFSMQNHLERIGSQADEIVRLLAEPGELSVTGQLATNPEMRQYLGYFEIKNVTANLNGEEYSVPQKIMISCGGKAYNTLKEKQPVIGDQVTVFGILQPATSLKNPNIFDYQAWLKTRGVSGSILVKKFNDVEYSLPAERNIRGKFHATFAGMRKWCMETYRANLPDEKAELVSSLTFGRANRLDPQLRRRFLRCGLMHVFAVSGLHIGILALIVFMTARLLQFEPRSAGMITILLLFCYMLLVGFRPSIVRAFIMASCFYFSFYLKTRIDILSSLSLAAFILLLFDPRQLLQPGFQLSFLAVLGIYFFYHLLYDAFTFTTENRDRKKNKYLFLAKCCLNKYVAAIIALTVAVMLMTIPLIASFFHQISISGILSNIFAMPLVALILADSILLLITASIAPSFAGVFANTASLLCDLLTGTVGFFSNWPLASIAQPTWPWYLVGIYYIMITVPKHCSAKPPRSMRQRDAPTCPCNAVP